ncbi:TPA: hypothetical protein JG832_002505 [Enterobacter hormaechei subsp. xiangfangensis]|nr:hypothetical protein [Enterobacter hormaechei subsp. xiangfangensis]HAV1890640.1 hypothetical protein [Enterobacter hormaechei subsp. xiangfangensis]
MKKNDVCIFCGAPATLLCDGHLGYPPATPDQEHRAYKGLDLLRPVTCDAPMCEACASREGSYIACHRGKGCIHDTLDYCPGCTAEREKATKPNRRRIEDDKQAHIIRASHWRTYAKGQPFEIKQGGGQMNLFEG